jgi:hypothetical protein
MFTEDPSEKLSRGLLALDREQCRGNKIVNWPLSIETAPACYGPLEYTGNANKRRNPRTIRSVSAQFQLDIGKHLRLCIGRASIKQVLVVALRTGLLQRVPRKK